MAKFETGQLQTFVYAVQTFPVKQSLSPNIREIEFINCNMGEEDALTLVDN